MRTSLLLWMAGVPLSAFGQLPMAMPVPGGVAVVEVGTVETSAPAVHFDGHRVLVKRDDGRWLAVVGLPLSISPGEHDLQVVANNQSRLVAFSVRTHRYRTQRLTIANKRQVDPTAEDLKRIARERAIVLDAFSTWSDFEPETLRFIPPSRGRFSSEFGLRRIFNGQPRQPHSGLDIAAPEGTPVIAPLAGVVRVTGDFFFNGHTILVDHGRGLVTMYNHLSRIYVEPGAHVERGQPMGAIGKTGRVTGPHLHWSVSLNNARVDPKLFIDTNPHEPNDTLPSRDRRPEAIRPQSEVR